MEEMYPQEGIISLKGKKGLNYMKRMISVIVALSVSIFTLGNVNNVKANDFDSASYQGANEVYNEIYDDEDFRITINESGTIRTVETFDKIRQETSKVIYDKESNILSDEYGNYIGRGYVIASRDINGPFKAYFDLNSLTIGTVIAAIVAVSVVASAIATSGLGLAAFCEGAKIFFSVGGGGSFIQSLNPGFSLNGHFEYKQEINSKFTKARNIDRKLFVRNGYGNSYKGYAFSDGNWFEIVKQ